MTLKISSVVWPSLCPWDHVQMVETTYTGLICSKDFVLTPLPSTPSYLCELQREISSCPSSSHFHRDLSAKSLFSNSLNYSNKIQNKLSIILSLKITHYAMKLT